MRISLVLACLWLACVGGPALAQTPSPGDFVFVHSQDIHAMDPISGGWTTLAYPKNLPLYADYTGLTLAENNRDLILGIADFNSSPWAYSVVRLTPGSTIVTSLCTFGPDIDLSQGASPRFGLDQDGDTYFVVTKDTSSSLWTSHVHRVRSSGGVTTLIALPLPNRDTIDSAIVDPVADAMLLTANTVPNRDVWQVALPSGAVTTLIRGAPTTPVAIEPSTGHLVGYRGRDVLVFDRSGQTMTSFAHSTYVFDLRVDPFTGNILVGHVNGRYGSTLTEYSPSGKQLRSWWHRGEMLAFEIYGSRAVSGRGTARAGSAYPIRFSFPDMANAVYVGALSLARRPGIAIGGGMIHLAPDGLFFASLAGALTRGFAGTLDSRGEAFGTVMIPSGLTPGLTFYCAGIAVAGPRMRVGNSIGVTLRR